MGNLGCASMDQLDTLPRNLKEISSGWDHGGPQTHTICQVHSCVLKLVLKPDRAVNWPKKINQNIIKSPSGGGRARDKGYMHLFNLFTEGKRYICQIEKMGEYPRSKP